jgi:hypothetical protein
MLLFGVYFAAPPPFNEAIIYNIFAPDRGLLLFRMQLHS